MIKIAMPEIKRIESLAQGLGAISLAQGALRVGGVHKNIRSYVQQILNTDKADYYQSVIGIIALREKIAQKLSEKHSINLTAENIAITHGSVGAFASVCAIILGTGDEVIIPEPTYPTYKNLVSYVKGVAVQIPAFVSSEVSPGNLSWKFDIDQVKAATTDRTKMIIFPNPLNPLGFCVSKKELLELIEWCESRSIYLVVDEVYDDYIFEEEQFDSITPYVLESKFVIRLGSFSKNFAMSGWRIGYTVTQAALIPDLMAVQDTFLCCPNVPGQYAALYAMDNPEVTLESYKLVKQSRDIALNMLKPLQEAGIFSFSIPSAAFCIFLKTGLPDATELTMDILQKALVALVPGKDFGKSSDSYIRLCYARQPELVYEGVSRLQSYFGIKTEVIMPSSVSSFEKNL